MNFHFISILMRRFYHCLLSGLLLLAAASTSFAQTAVAPGSGEEAPASADRLQLRIGLNVARNFRHTNYYGYGERVPVSVSAEYALNRRFTLYGQVDAELGLFRQDPGRNLTKPLVPTGAFSIGTRYYYNQDGRMQHNRAHGLFVGNYLAAELHTEMLRYPAYVLTSPYPTPDGYYALRSEFTPTLNLLWGMQRRLGRNFLFDLNAGVGLGAKRSDDHFGGYSAGALNLSTQLNLGVYFGR